MTTYPPLTKATGNIVKPLLNKTATCWLWKGDKTEEGQPIVTIDGSTYDAREIVFYLAHQTVVSEEYDLKKTCKKDLCVSPAHTKLVKKTSTKTDIQE